jgi:hypothetical protein
VHGGFAIFLSGGYTEIACQDCRFSSILLNFIGPTPITELSSVAMKQNLMANSLWQSAVYDINGHLLAFVRRSTKQKVKTGFVHMDEKNGDTVHFTETSVGPTVNDLVGENPQFGAVNLDQGGYFQASLPLNSANSKAGWLTVLV